MRLFAGGLAALALLTAQDAVAQDAAATACAVGAPTVRTMLFFGRSKPRGGTVSELDWQVFLRDEVTPRFPGGLTVMDSQGQWRGPRGVLDQENGKVLYLTHPDDAASRQAISQIVAAYIKAFEQEAVMWETSKVCVAFVTG